MNDKKTWNWDTTSTSIDLNSWKKQTHWIEEFKASPDGKTIAAIVNTDEMEFSVCVNGQLWENTFEKAWSLTFLPDRRLAVLAANDEEWTVYIDDKAWESRIDYIWGLQWSDDGSHVAAAVQKDMTYGMIVDDTVWENLYENLTCPLLDNSGATAAVVQKESLAQGDIENFRQGIFCAAVNGTPQDPQFVNIWDLSFDSRGRKIAYAVRENRSDYTVVKDTVAWSESFQAAWKPLFSDRDNSVIAPVRHKGKWYLYKDGEPFWENGFEQLWKQVVAPQTLRVAAVAAPTFGKWTVCEQEKCWDLRANGMIHDLFYSDDGQKLLATVKHNHFWDVAVDGRPWGLSCNRLWQPAVNGNGSTIAARMVQNGKYRLAVNAKVLPQSYDLAFDPIIHPDGEKILFRTIKNNTYSRTVLNRDDLV